MSLPIGTVIPYLGQADSLNNLEANGWLVCDGRSLGTTDYQALNEVIGDAYGSAGAGSFNLPQLSGMFLRGIDPGGKFDPDAAARTSPDPSSNTQVGPVVGSRQADQLRNHVHNWDQNFGQITDGGSDINVQLALNSPRGGDLGSQPTTNKDGGGNETRPANVYVYYLIFAGN
jgi:rhizosphere induced protein